MPISSHELKHFLSVAFVETGCAALGLGVQSALNAGFPKIYSIDINEESYNQCSGIFENEPKVKIDLGDCGPWLEKTLNEINEPCTLFLDANGWEHETEHPFISSVESIKKHGRKDHIILVDDMNHGKVTREALIKECRNPNHYIISLLRQINPDYHFYLIDTHLEDMSHTFPSWVLVADPIKYRFLDTPEEEYI